MTEPTQTVLALALIAAAVVFLVWRSLRRKGKGCEDADCGCAKNTLRNPRK